MSFFDRHFGKILIVGALGSIALLLWAFAAEDKRWEREADTLYALCVADTARTTYDCERDRVMLLAGRRQARSRDMAIVGAGAAVGAGVSAGRR